jgi:hypothetical protein
MNKLKLNSNIINIIGNYLTISKNEIKIKKKDVMGNLLGQTIGLNVYLNAIHFQYMKNFKIISYKYKTLNIWTLQQFRNIFDNV